MKKLHLLLCGHGELNEHLHGLADEPWNYQIIYRFRIQEDMLEIFGAGYLLFPSFRKAAAGDAGGYGQRASDDLFGDSGQYGSDGDSWTLSADRKRKLCPGGLCLTSFRMQMSGQKLLRICCPGRIMEDGEACIQRSQEFSLDGGKRR